MTEKHPDRPRVGDQITTAEQIEALPVGTVVRDHMGETHVSYLSVSRSARFWQEVGVGDERSSYSMTREIGGTFTVLYVPGEPSRPSVTDCGGCRGLGAHSPRCFTQPGFLWLRWKDQAEALGDGIGSNDPALANQAYALAADLERHWQRTRAVTETLAPEADQ